MSEDFFGATSKHASQHISTAPSTGKAGVVDALRPGLRTTLARLRTSTSPKLSQASTVTFVATQTWCARIISAPLGMRMPPKASSATFSTSATAATSNASCTAAAAYSGSDLPPLGCSVGAKHSKQTLSPLVRQEIQSSRLRLFVDSQIALEKSSGASAPSASRRAPLRRNCPTTLPAWRWVSAPRSWWRAPLRPSWSIAPSRS